MRFYISITLLLMVLGSCSQKLQPVKFLTRKSPTQIVVMNEQGNTIVIVDSTTNLNQWDKFFIPKK